MVTPRFEATQVLYAHRQQANLLVTEVLLKRCETSAEPITIQLESSFKPQTEDIDLQNAADYKGGRYSRFIIIAIGLFLYLFACLIAIGVFDFGCGWI